ncbi:alpha/beta fold hydrolase [Catenuloplanes sp. NPDC051500]|uniref:alpha/beta fold hydrolase n=1 Tax=Catenuloplanes sp. NPDC051500 TaxID=3363959 RepID=UPI00378A53E6
MSLGIDRPTAEQLAAAQDADMGRALLTLYRSAKQPVLADLGRALPSAAARPGLALVASEDHHVGTVDQRRRAAGLAGAHVEILEGAGHWWMTQDPAGAAAVLATFWSSVPAPLS